MIFTGSGTRDIKTDTTDIEALAHTQFTSPRNPTVPTFNHTLMAESTQSPRSKIHRLSPIFSIFSPPSKLHQPQRQVTCDSCLSNDLPSPKTAKLECGRRIYHACLGYVFLPFIQGPQLTLPRCCTRTPISLQYVRRFFGDEFKRTWNKKLDEYTTKKRLHCPSKACGEWIPPKYIQLDRSVGQRYGTYPKCRTRVCENV